MPVASVSRARDGGEVGHQRERLVHDRLVRVGRQRRVGVELRVGPEDVVGHEEVVAAHRFDGPDELADGADVRAALGLGKDHAELVAMPLRYAPPVTTSVWPLTKSLSGLQKR